MSNGCPGVVGHRWFTALCTYTIYMYACIRNMSLHLRYNKCNVSKQPITSLHCTFLQPANIVVKYGLTTLLRCKCIFKLSSSIISRFYETAFINPDLVFAHFQLECNICIYLKPDITREIPTASAINAPCNTRAATLAFVQNTKKCCAKRASYLERWDSNGMDFCKSYNLERQWLKLRARFCSCFVILPTKNTQNNRNSTPPKPGIA